MKPLIHPETCLSDLNLDYLLYSPAFILPVLFPSIYNATKILSRNFEIEKSGFETILNPSESIDANLNFVATAQGIDFDGKKKNGFEGEGKYDYIVLNPDRSESPDANQLNHYLTVLMPLLKPGGIIAGRVFGYAGYYGLNMLRSIAKRFETGDSGVESKPPVNYDNTVTLIRKIINAVPENHPSFLRKEFMEKLQDGNPGEIGIFLTLDPGKIFTLSQLIHTIESGGREFLEPVLPGLYNPIGIISDTAVTDRIISLPAPHRWKTAELVNAWPPEHYFFIKKTDSPSVKIHIPWSNADPEKLFSWRPLLLPLYEWNNLKTDNPIHSEYLLKPISQLKGINPIKLNEWEAQFFRLCNGISSIDDLRFENEIKNVPVEDMIGFLKLALEYRLIALLPA